MKVVEGIDTCVANLGLCPFTGSHVGEMSVSVGFIRLHDIDEDYINPFEAPPSETGEERAFFVECGCGARGPLCDSVDEAVDRWNHLPFRRFVVYDRDRERNWHLLGGAGGIYPEIRIHPCAEGDIYPRRVAEAMACLAKWLLQQDLEVQSFDADPAEVASCEPHSEPAGEVVP